MPAHPILRGGMQGGVIRRSSLERWILRVGVLVDADENIAARRHVAAQLFRGGCDPGLRSALEQGSEETAVGLHLAEELPCFLRQLGRDALERPGTAGRVEHGIEARLVAQDELCVPGQATRGIGREAGRRIERDDRQRVAPAEDRGEGLGRGPQKVGVRVDRALIAGGGAGVDPEVAAAVLPPAGLADPSPQHPGGAKLGDFDQKPRPGGESDEQASRRRFGIEAAALERPQGLDGRRQRVGQLLDRAAAGVMPAGPPRHERAQTWVGGGGLRLDPGGERRQPIIRRLDRRLRGLGRPGQGIGEGIGADTAAQSRWIDSSPAHPG